MLAVLAWIWGPGLIGAGANENRYEITDLGTLGGQFSEGHSINDNGQVAGYSHISSGALRPFLWTPGGTAGHLSNPQMQDLGTLGREREYSRLQASINLSGQIAGVSAFDHLTTPEFSQSRAFLWTPSGTFGSVGNPQMRDLGSLEIGGWSSAGGINDAGQVCGEDYGNRAFLYEPPHMVRIGGLGAFSTSSTATAINNLGQIVGCSPVILGHAFLWTPGGTSGGAGNPPMQDLGTLAGPSGVSDAWAVNDNAQVTGSATTVDFRKHAFLWTSGGTDGPGINPEMRDLGTLPGSYGDQSAGYGINDRGHVVGASFSADPKDSHAFVHNGKRMLDLNDQIPSNSGWVLIEARDINNKGQIVGFGRFHGALRGFLLTPKPATFGVFIGSDELLPDGRTFNVHGTKDAREVRARFQRLIPSMISSFLGYFLEDPRGGAADEIYEELDLYTDMVQPGDNFIFYYHGHGSGSRTDPGNQESLVITLVDGEIVDEDLTDWFNDPVRLDYWDGVNKLFVLDACYSGGFWASEQPNLSALNNAALLAAARELSAGSLNVLEHVRPGHSGEGYFSAAYMDAIGMVRGFANADFNHDGLTIQEMSDYMATKYPADLYPNGLTGYINGPFSQEPVTAPWEFEVFQSPGFKFNVAQELPPPGNLVAFELEGGQLHMNILTVSNRNYLLQSTLDLPSTNWVDVTTIVGNGNIMRVSVPVSTSIARTFFRVSFAAPEPPVISQHPESQTLNAGASGLLSVAATGTPPFRYQWQKNRLNISGATSSTLPISNASESDEGSYRVSVGNEAGTATSLPATLAVRPPPVSPVITQQPASQIVTVGTSVLLSVVATGTSPLTYQWEKDGTEIAGATGPLLAFPNITQADEGTYQVVVANAGGFARSAEANLIVNPTLDQPVITRQPVSRTVSVGSTVLFGIQATGLTPLNYQWFHGSDLIPGANANELSLTDTQFEDSGNYTVQVGNSAGSATSQVAVLVVREGPVISIERSGPDFILNWTPVEDLAVQASSSVEGFWSEIYFGLPPYVHSPVGIMEIYRTMSAEGTPSVNSIALITVPLSPGTNLIANPLSYYHNHLNLVLPLPDYMEGATVTRFDVATQTFRPPMEWIAGSGWVSADPDEDFLMPPGEGFLFWNPLPVGFDALFIGELPQDCVAHALPPANGSALKGSIMPLAVPLGDGTLFGTLMFPAEDQDIVSLWDPSSQAFQEAYTYFDGFGWVVTGDFSGIGPIIPVGRGFKIVKSPAASQTQWIQCFLP